MESVSNKTSNSLAFDDEYLSKNYLRLCKEYCINDKMLPYINFKLYTDDVKKLIKVMIDIESFGRKEYYFDKLLLMNDDNPYGTKYDIRDRFYPEIYHDFNCEKSIIMEFKFDKNI